MLTWHPAGDVPATCSRGGYSPSWGGGGVVVRCLLATGTVLESTAGMCFGDTVGFMHIVMYVSRY